MSRPAESCASAIRQRGARVSSARAPQRPHNRAPLRPAPHPPACPPTHPAARRLPTHQPTHPTPRLTRIPSSEEATPSLIQRRTAPAPARSSLMLATALGGRAGRRGGGKRGRLGGARRGPRRQDKVASKGTSCIREGGDGGDACHVRGRGLPAGGGGERTCASRCMAPACSSARRPVLPPSWRSASPPASTWAAPRGAARNEGRVLEWRGVGWSGVGVG